MNTGNPALNERYFAEEANVVDRSGVMTIQGTVIKTAVLLAVMIAVAGLAWSLTFPQGISLSGDQATSLYVNKKAMIGCLAGGAIGGLILSLIICFVPKTAPICAPLYAACEGAFVGAVSGLYAVGSYPAIIAQAIMLTIGVFVTMLALYMTGIIKMSDKLRIGIIVATGGIALVYLATMILSFFGVQMPYIHGAGPIGIGFSIVVVIIAAFNLVLDFDTIERSARYNAPKYMEWFGAFGLLVTLVWLYIEILRLLSKLNRSGD